MFWACNHWLHKLYISTHFSQLGPHRWWCRPGQAQSPPGRSCGLPSSCHGENPTQCGSEIWLFRTDFEIMYRHWSIPYVHLKWLTIYICIGVTNQHEYTLAQTSQFLFVCEWVLVNQILSFFSPHYFFPTSYTCTTYPGFESSLKNTFSWFFWFVFGVRHDRAYLKMTTQKSKVLEGMTILKS